MAAAQALRAWRAKVRQLDLATEKSIQDPPSFRGELSKARDFNPTGISYEDTTIDWDTVHKNLPHHTLTINAFQKFFEQQRDLIMKEPNTIPPKVHAAYLEKAREAEKMAGYAKGPLLRIAKELEERKETLEEKERFLVEEKIDNILKRNPEWAAAIQDQLANLRYKDPLRGTHFQEDS